MLKTEKPKWSDQALWSKKEREGDWTWVPGSWLGSISISSRTFHHLPRWRSSKESAYQCRTHRRCRFDPWVRKIPWRRKWQPTSVFLHGKSQGQRSLVGYSSWGHKESDTTEGPTTTNNQLWTIVIMYWYWFISYDTYIILTNDINKRENKVWV